MKKVRYYKFERSTVKFFERACRANISVATIAKYLTKRWPLWRREVLLLTIEGYKDLVVHQEEYFAPPQPIYRGVHQL